MGWREISVVGSAAAAVDVEHDARVPRRPARPGHRSGRAAGRCWRSAVRRESRTPPISPWSAIQCTSSTASSMLLSRICPMPARRPGKRAHQSASQRLCARRPASRCSYSSGVGTLLTKTAAGEERRNGVGKDDLADDSVGFQCGIADAVVPVAVGVRRSRSPKGLTYAVGPSVEVVPVARLQIGPVVAQVRTCVAVG